MDVELNIKFSNLMQSIEEKTKRKDKSLQFYFNNAVKNKNEKQIYIFNILNSFPLFQKQIYIKNKNYQIFYSKFLDISKQIIEDDNNKIKPEIIIYQEDIKKLGKDKELILLYIKISLFYEENALKILFHFLNQNFISLNNIFFHFIKKDDITNIDKLKKVFNNAKICKPNLKRDSNFRIKIMIEDERKKENGKLKEMKKIELKKIISNKKEELIRTKENREKKEETKERKKVKKRVKEPHLIF